VRCRPAHDVTDSDAALPTHQLVESIHNWSGNLWQIAFAAETYSPQIDIPEFNANHTDFTVMGVQLFDDSRVGTCNRAYLSRYTDGNASRCRTGATTCSAISGWTNQ
jgi:hypothetical protein